MKPESVSSRADNGRGLILTICDNGRGLILTICDKPVYIFGHVVF